MVAVLLAAGLTLQVYNNTALAGLPSTTTTSGFPISLRPHAYNNSAEATGTVTFPSYGDFVFQCNFSSSVVVGFVWFSDHEVCVHGAYTNDVHDRSSMDGSPAYPLLVTEAMDNMKMPIRIHIWTGANSAAAAAVDVQWQQVSGPTPTSTPPSHSSAAPRAAFQSIPTSALEPEVSLLEARRRSFQRNLLYVRCVDCCALCTVHWLTQG